MKKLIVILFIIFNFSAYSQEVNFGLRLGTGLSSQTLESDNSPYTAGQTWNTIGGLPYRVDPYVGYNAGIMIELFSNGGLVGILEHLSVFMPMDQVQKILLA